MPSVHSKYNQELPQREINLSDLPEILEQVFLPRNLATIILSKLANYIVLCNGQPLQKKLVGLSLRKHHFSTNIKFLLLLEVPMLYVAYRFLMEFYELLFPPCGCCAFFVVKIGKRCMTIGPNHR